MFPFKYITGIMPDGSIIPHQSFDIIDVEIQSDYVQIYSYNRVNYVRIGHENIIPFVKSLTSWLREEKFEESFVNGSFSFKLEQDHDDDRIYVTINNLPHSGDLLLNKQQATALSGYLFCIHHNQKISSPSP